MPYYTRRQKARLAGMLALLHHRVQRTHEQVDEFAEVYEDWHRCLHETERHIRELEADPNRVTFSDGEVVSETMEDEQDWLAEITAAMTLARQQGEGAAALRRRLLEMVRAVEREIRLREFGW
ncbi:hypothetical protein MMC24_007343 [Lignoscripta atroalba]|nr:hypothetical protein [Lignoscripta atroalba]